MFMCQQGSRLGVTTVVSTDSIRHMMRSFVEEKENPLLWASTYHAGECLDPVAVAEEKLGGKQKNAQACQAAQILITRKVGLLLKKLKGNQLGRSKWP